MRRALSFILAILLLLIGGGAYVYMIHAHSGARWMFSGVAMLFMAGVMVAYDEVARPPSITCPKCWRISYHPRDIEHRYCGACGYHDGIGSK